MASPLWHFQLHYSLTTTLARNTPVDHDIYNTSAKTIMRNAIWELVLPQNSIVHVPRGHLGCREVLPPLLRVNSQIRRETLTMFFGANTFMLWIETQFERNDYRATARWVCAIGANSALLLKLTLRDSSTGNGYEVDLAEKTVRKLYVSHPWEERNIREVRQLLGRRADNASQSPEDLLELLALFLKRE